jgi:hypothetical protein
MIRFFICAIGLATVAAGIRLEQSRFFLSSAASSVLRTGHDPDGVVVLAVPDLTARWVSRVANGDGTFRETVFVLNQQGSTLT